MYKPNGERLCRACTTGAVLLVSLATGLLLGLASWSPLVGVFGFLGALAMYGVCLALGTLEWHPGWPKFRRGPRTRPWARLWREFVGTVAVFALGGLAGLLVALATGFPPGAAILATLGAVVSSLLMALFGGASLHVGWREPEAAGAVPSLDA